MGKFESEYVEGGFYALIKFSSNGILKLLQTVTLGGDHTKNYTEYYGTYELNDKKLSITLSLKTDVNLTCIVHDNGDFITIGGEKFERVKLSGISKSALKLFEK